MRTTVSLPRQYQYMTVLGEGAYGMVMKCVKKDTKDVVAVKIPRRFDHNTSLEVSLRSLLKYFFYFVQLD